MKKMPLTLVLFCSIVLLQARSSPAQQPSGRLTRPVRVTEASGKSYRVTDVQFTTQCAEFGLALPWGECIDFWISEFVTLAVPARSVRSIECAAGRETDIPWHTGKVWPEIVALPFCRVSHISWGSEVTFSGKLSSNLVGTTEGKSIALGDTDIRQILFEGGSVAYEAPPPLTASVLLRDGSTLKLGNLRPRRRSLTLGPYAYKTVGPGGAESPLISGGAAFNLPGDAELFLEDGSRLSLPGVRSIAFHQDRKAEVTMRDGSRRSVTLSSRASDETRDYAGVSEQGYVTFYFVSRIEFASQSHAQTADKAPDLSKWDSAWELFGASDRLLTEITVKNGKIDFSRPAGQSRAEALKTLHAAGVRRIYSSILSPLAINSQGQIGPSFSSESQRGLFQAIKAKDGAYNLGAMANAKGHNGLTFSLPSQSGFFQALKESNDGFDLANGEGSQILDTSGSVLATVTSTKGAPSLAFTSRQSLKTLYEGGLRFFYYRFEPVIGEMKPRVIKLIKDDKGEVKLEP